MPDNPTPYSWPPPEKRKYIGGRSKRVDGPQKVAGRAKYTYDIVRPGMLYGAILRSPHAHARIKSIDVSAAEAMPGVKAVVILQGPGAESGAGEAAGPSANAVVHWEGDEIVALAAVDERVARDALRAIKIDYEPLPHRVIDQQEPPRNAAPDTGPLAQTDIQDMMSNQVPTPQVIKALQERGI